MGTVSEPAGDSTLPPTQPIGAIVAIVAIGAIGAIDHG